MPYGSDDQRKAVWASKKKINVDRSGHNFDKVGDVSDDRVRKANDKKQLEKFFMDYQMNRSHTSDLSGNSSVHDIKTQKEYEAFERLSKLPKSELYGLSRAIDEAIEHYRFKSGVVQN